MLLGQTDPVVIGAYAAAATSLVPAVLAYRRGRRADDRSVAVAELELAVTSMRHDADALRGRLDECEKDRRRLWERVHELERGHV